MSSDFLIPLVCFAVVFTVLGLFSRWLKRGIEAERPRKLGTVQHEVFGTVTLLTDHWQASVLFPPTDTKIDVTSFETSQPTRAEEILYLEIARRYDSLIPLLTGKFEEAGRERGKPYGKWELETICLDTTTEFRSFSLLFEVEGSEWGFDASFVDFELDEFGDLH